MSLRPRKLGSGDTNLCCAESFFELLSPVMMMAVTMTAIEEEE